MKSSFLVPLTLLVTLASTPGMAQWKTPPAWQPSQESTSLEEEHLQLQQHASAAINFRDGPRRGWAEQWARLVLPAAAGAAIGGLAGGYSVGYLLEEGLNAGYAGTITGGVAGLGIGSTLGSAGAATLMGTSQNPVSFSRAAAGAAVGFIPAYLFVALVAEQPSRVGTFALFGLAQGAVAALFASYPSASEVP
jgi:hypothetical protein